MSTATVSPLPSSVDATRALLSGENYLADRSLAVVVFLALRLGRPLFLEGDAGVGKTEIAKALAAGLGRNLIRLQCYEGLDATAAVYEWNYLAGGGRPFGRVSRATGSRGIQRAVLAEASALAGLGARA